MGGNISRAETQTEAEAKAGLHDQITRSMSDSCKIIYDQYMAAKKIETPPRKGCLQRKK